MGKKKTGGKKSPSFESVVDDLTTRFILNLPSDGHLDTARLFFQLEQAHWYYEDFVAEHHSHLPHFHALKQFCKMMFAHCFPHMKGQFGKLYAQFAKYKAHIPTYGAILMNAKQTKVILVESWKGKVWGFPRGKINQGESDSSGAIREVQEEVGFDITSRLDSTNFIELAKQSSGKVTKLFIICDVPEDVNFAPEVRKEIRSVAWFPINGILDEKWRAKHASTGTFKIAIPFVRQLKRWIRTCKKSNATVGTQDCPANNQSRARSSTARSSSEPRPKTEARTQRSRSAPHNRGSRQVSWDRNNADTFGLKSTGRKTHGWSPDAMFAENERILGKKFVYDGNPQTFGIASAPPLPRLSGTSSVSSRKCAKEKSKPGLSDAGIPPRPGRCRTKHRQRSPCTRKKPTNNDSVNKKKHSNSVTSPSSEPVPSNAEISCSSGGSRRVNAPRSPSTQLTNQHVKKKAQLLQGHSQESKQDASVYTRHPSPGFTAKEPVEPHETQSFEDLLSFSFNKNAIMASLKLRCTVK